MYEPFLARSWELDLAYNI